MTTKKEYSRLLNTKEWHEKRLKILNRDNNQCTRCGKEGRLFVHHKYYLKYPNGVMVNPWEYSDKALITLCYGCHKMIHKTTEVYVKYIPYKKITNYGSSRKNFKQNS